MRILLTNDDGIHAPGFAALESIAAKFSDDVWSVAPAEEQSGAGHSLTLTRPIRLRKLGEKKYSVSGTPTDAVMMALAHIMKDNPPDLILSGINRGANLAEDVTYSGTVSAAMEGALAGVRSIALSQVYAREGMGDTVPFAAAEAWAERVLRPLVETPFAPGTLVNVNFPALPSDAVKGIRICRQGIRDYGRLRIVERTDPRGYRYEHTMSGIGRKITSVAIAVSLCTVPTVAIGATPAAPAAAGSISTAVPQNPWLTLSAMTTSSSAAVAAAAAQDGRGGPGFPPVAPLAVILATIAAMVYILVKDNSGNEIHLPLPIPVSPS